MPLFQYKGLDKNGKNIRGHLDAENTRLAQTVLKKRGIFVVDLLDKSKIKGKGSRRTNRLFRGVSIKDLSLMTRQLATLLRANIPLVDSLEAVSDQVENPILSEVMVDIKNRVNEGISFYSALEKHPKIFNKIYISMCKAGEMAGNLDKILIRLAELTESVSGLKNKILFAMMYPAGMLLMAIGIVIFLFVSIVPEIKEIFQSFPELILPWYTKAFFSLGDYLTEHWLFILILVILSGFLFFYWKKTPRGKTIWDRWILKFPVFGPLLRMVAISRFTRVLSTLLEGGVPMLSSLNLVKNVVNNVALSNAVDEARENISEGESISGPLKKSGEFPPVVIHMIHVGEKTGELEYMLVQLSDFYDNQVQTAVGGLTALLEPIMLVVMGGVIGFIAFSIMIPLSQISGIGGG